VAFVAASGHFSGQRAAACVLAVVTLAACSSGPEGSSNGNGACALIAKLDDTAAAVARADVSDPTAFRRTLDDAVAQYLATLRALRPRIPPAVQNSVDRVIADVQQLRFDDAQSDRAELDDYAEHECGRTAATTSATSR
jgi:hypothetical protein